MSEFGTDRYFLPAYCAIMSTSHKDLYILYNKLELNN